MLLKKISAGDSDTSDNRIADINLFHIIRNVKINRRICQYIPEQIQQSLLQELHISHRVLSTEDT